MAKKRASQSAAPQTAPKPDVMDREAAISYLIRMVWEFLQHRGIEMEQRQDLSGSHGRDTYASKPSKRQRKSYAKKSVTYYCEPRITIQPVEDGTVAQFKIEIDNVHICHEAMRDPLMTSFNISWHVNLQNEDERTTEAMSTTARNTTTQLVIRYLRARQACMECMIRSRRLRKKALKFVKEAISAANGN